jgi:hypothetical protein
MVWNGEKRLNYTQSAWGITGRDYPSAGRPAATADHGNENTQNQNLTANGAEFLSINPHVMNKCGVAVYKRLTLLPFAASRQHYSHEVALTSI